MFRRSLKVTYSPLKNNFVLLPDQYYRLVSAYRNGCMNVAHTNGIGNHYITWTPYPISTKENDIGINPQVAESIGLREGDVVNVSMVIEARGLKRVEVSPCTETDWTMMEINANRIQSILLDQTKIVNKGQILVIWINDSIVVKAKVDFMMPPMPFGRLENDTELVVVPWSKKIPNLPAAKQQKIKDIPKESPLTTIEKSPTNSEIAKLVEKRKLQRRNTAELLKLPNGTTEKESPKKSRPVSWYKHAVEDIHKKEKEEEIPIPIVPLRANSLKKNKSVRHSMYERLADEPVKKIEDLPPPIPDPPAFLKRNNSTLFEKALDNHLNNIKTSKSAVSMICNGDKEETGLKYRNKSEYIDDLVACLAKETMKNFEFRVIPGVWNDKNYHQISDLFLTKDNLPSGMDPNVPFLLMTDGNKEFFVNVKIVKDPAKFPRNIYPSIEINDKLRNLLDLNVYEKVILRPQHRLVNLVEKIDLLPSTKVLPNIRKDIEDKFKEFIINNSKLYPVILNQDQVFKILDHYFTVKLEPENLRFCLVNAQILKENRILCVENCKNVDSIIKQDETENKIYQKKEISIEKFDKIVEKCVDRLMLKLCLDERSQCRKIENILIAGPTFSGKRTVCNKIIKALQEAPYFCYATTFQCSKHKGRKPDSIQKDLRHQFYLSMYHTPSVVFLDNLDVVVHHPTEQNTQDGEYYNKIADIFRSTIEEFTTNNAISVIATVSNISSLNRRVHSSRGHHIFNHILKMPTLDKTDRELVVKNLCANTKCKLDKKTNYKKFSILTEGYTIGNLVQFIDRAVFYAFKRSFKAPTLTDEMLNQALEVTNSFCLQGIENHPRNEYDEDEDDEIAGDKVPGLENVIDVFQEVLMWPSKFPKIFENSPLRNQAGVLLFGPPGTGKTYLVAKLSKTWNLRMISVKGPELLAKYIGQSEENVRNLFDKARSAKPCVLFFDEFDSLAPRRGHDSTGVTDRVVNQLLTELDGVEGLHGVTVIGATSRPELLDPALLRSGRMDRLVECYLPNKKARLEIFQNLSKSLHFDESVKLKHFADRSDNYTGADIRSILTSANMIAVQECLKNNTENVPDKIYITQKHLTEAFNSTRPSLSPTDIAKYKLKYAKFTNKETVNDFLAQRATLA